jgi:hypothetical protein
VWQRISFELLSIGVGITIQILRITTWFGFVLIAYPVGQKLDASEVDNAQPSGSTFCYSGPAQYYFQILCANISSWTLAAKDAP